MKTKSQRRKIKKIKKRFIPKTTMSAGWGGGEGKEGLSGAEATLSHLGRRFAMLWRRGGEEVSSDNSVECHVRVGVRGKE